MSESGAFVPWQQRRPRAWSGLSSWIVRAAAGTYRLVAPMLTRAPGMVFLGALVSVAAGPLAVGLLFQALEAAREHAGADAWMTVTELRAGLTQAGSAVPAELVYPLQSQLVRDLVGMAGILGFVSLLPVFGIWWERKVSAFIQSRLGPTRTGGWHGWSQSIADGIKLLAKEDLVPENGDRALFRLAPYLSFVPAVLAFVALPFGTYWVFRELDVALLFVLAMLGLEVLGVLIAGWASGNKWSVFGALREAAQVVSYEIPMGFSLLVPVLVAGTLQLGGPLGVAAQQAGGWFHWLAWHSPWTFIAFFTYFIASLAACKRAPFDLPEAESELVAGFHTEYSGFRWSLFFFAEYTAMFVVSALAVTLFLGAWDAPWAGLAPQSWLQPDASIGVVVLRNLLISGPIWFILKAFLLVFVQMWLRWTLPRIRIDQVLYSCVQVMLPLTMLTLLAATIWELARDSSRGFAAFAQVVSVALGGVGLLIVVALAFVALGGMLRGGRLVGPLGRSKILAGG